MYAKCIDFKTASTMLQDTEVDDVVSWNSMVVECASEVKQCRSNNLVLEPSLLNKQSFLFFFVKFFFQLLCYICKI